MTGMIVLAGCGGQSGDAVHHDGGNLDSAPIPPPPVLGAQIDRMGRPLIGTALIGTFKSPSDQAMIRDAYNHASDPATWATTTISTNVTIETEMETNLAVFDAFDIADTDIAGAGCGNAVRYQVGPGMSPYRLAADLFADDELYVDTAFTTCSIYLALEMQFATANGRLHTTCGGRMPSHDVVDITYSMLAAGRDGIDPTSSDGAPKIHDGVAAHTDIKETVFPFLGPPHP
ncbi:MAG TPA: hypothetical protein VF516_05940 [Kofleriaceae bacterium]